MVRPLLIVGVFLEAQAFKLIECIGCVYMLMCVHIQMCKLAYVCVCVNVDAKVSVEYFLLLLFTSFGDSAFHGTWSLRIHLDWQANDPQGSSCL